MVKSGSTRSQKFSAKHDAKVITMRLKALSNTMKQLFQKTAFQFELVDLSFTVLMEELNLAYGQYGQLTSILKEYLWRYDNLSVPDLEALHTRLVNLGYTEDEWNLISDWLEQTAHLIKSRYETCHIPPTRLLAVVQAQLDKDTD